MCLLFIIIHQSQCNANKSFSGTIKVLQLIKKLHQKLLSNSDYELSCRWLSFLDAHRRGGNNHCWVCLQNESSRTANLILDVPPFAQSGNVQSFPSHNCWVVKPFTAQDPMWQDKIRMWRLVDWLIFVHQDNCHNAIESEKFRIVSIGQHEAFDW